MTTASEARQGLSDLVSLARRDLAAFFDLVGSWPAADVRDALMEVLPAIGDAYGDAAAAVAADYYESAREVAQVRGRFAPVVAEPPSPARWEALARWGVDPLFSGAPNAAAALSLVGGGLARSVADQYRNTVIESSMADPQAAGWQRVTRAGACGFCRMLADRGGVYTERSVEFKSHDNCGCSAAPTWDPKVRKIIGVPFRHSQRRDGWSDERKARENRRAYDYIAEHYGD